MATYKIDANRGSDSNDGTTAPWLTLAPLASVTWAAGDRVLFADDSDFNTSTRVLLAACTGTAAAPIVFDRYNPLGGESTSYPIFRGYYEFASGAWTWDAAKSAWYAAEPLSLTSGFPTNQGGGVMLLGASNEEHGVYIRAFSSPNTAFTVDGEWGVDTTNRRYYLKSPESTNPTAYFGRVRLGRPVNSYAPFVFNKCGSYVSMRNLKFQEAGCGVLIGLFNTGGASDITGFEMEGCRAYDVGNLLRFQADYTASTFEFVHRRSRFVRNNIERNAGAGFHVSNAADLYIAHNTGSGNTGRSWPIGYVYVDSSDAHAQTGGGIIECNDFSSAAHGSEWSGGDNAFDGCTIYLEAGSQNLIARRNIARDSLTGFQDNSGRGTNLWESNLAIDCDRLIQLTDQSALGGGACNVYNNTGILRGGDDYIPAAAGKTEPLRTGIYLDGIAGDTANIKNNLLVSISGQSAGISLNTLLTTATDSNAFWGVTGQVKTLGGVARPDATNSITDDPMVTASGRPMPGSPLLPGGADLGYIRDIEGKQSRNHIGAFGAATLIAET